MNPCVYVVVVMMSCIFFSFSCRILKPLEEERSLQKATSITYPEVGDVDRCDNIYPDVYNITTPIFASLMDRYQEHMDSGGQIVTNPQALEILVGTRQMLLNIMGNSDRPLHPVAFMAVIKDFEMALRNDWSGQAGTDHHTRFRAQTPNCWLYPCDGLFQVNIGLEGMHNAQKLPSQRFLDICGTHGLNILGLPGSLDVCAFLFWWFIPRKCAQLREGKNQRKNPCTHEDYPWSTNTFAYTYADAYIQENQFARWEISTPWVKLYEGGRFTFRDEYDHYFMGYEHCAARHYLRKYLDFSLDQAAEKGNTTPSDLFKGAAELRDGDWVDYAQGGGYVIKDIKAGDPAVFDTEAGRKLMQAVVKDYGKQINLLPSWAQPQDQEVKKVHHSVTTKPGYRGNALQVQERKERAAEEAKKVEEKAN